MKREIFINSFILSIGILLGRLSGYIRELVIAYKFDVSADSDTIILMLTVPDLLNNLLSSGAISGLLIPILSKDKNPIEGILQEFTLKLFKITLMLYLLVVLSFLFLYELHLYVLIIISLLSVFPNVLTFISVSFLQFKKKFKELSLNTLFFNSILILFLLLGFKNYFFAVGVILAAIFRMLWMYYNLKKNKINTRLVLSLEKKNKKNTISYRLMVFMIFANGVVFVLPMIDKIFASFLNEGSIALLSYAEKIYFLPVSVFLTTYAVAMFPDLSKMIADNKFLEANKLLNRVIFFNLILSLTIAVVFYFFSYDIVKLFYGISKVKESNIILVSEVLKSFTIAIIFAGTNSILLNLVFANKWYKVLIYYSVSILSLKLILNFMIKYYDFEVRFIPLGTSLLMLISVIGLYLTYKSKIKKIKIAEV
ncbi:murein biosynthesis integral membrane protein MurJ [Tenacibaculum amylolyticum]|uniref:murein biosynthesis integral membrane protein MurJ n=1 Tax=Tenacibaculum amylolyticum TaxID=104269 RepID=UPI00389505F2